MRKNTLSYLLAIPYFAKPLEFTITFFCRPLFLMEIVNLHLSPGALYSIPAPYFLEKMEAIDMASSNSPSFHYFPPSLSIFLSNTHLSTLFWPRSILPPSPIPSSLVSLAALSPPATSSQTRSLNNTPVLTLLALYEIIPFLITLLELIVHTCSFHFCISSLTS